MLNESGAATAAIMETDFVDTARRDDTDKRAHRYIVFAGDRMYPDQKRTFDGMEIGGDVLGHDYKTLVPTKGLLRRCQITPMMPFYSFENDEALGDDKSRVHRVERFALTHDDPDNPEKRRRIVQYAYDAFPGEELAGLFTACQGIYDYGIREVEVLRGVDFKDAKNRNLIDDYQRQIFPDWNRYLLPEGDDNHLAFFATTGELRDHLTERSYKVDSTVRSIIGTFLSSLAQFERWATRQLDNHGRLVKAPPTPEGRIYGWDSIHHQWFDQLELNKDEFLMKKEERRESDTPTRAEFLEYQRQSAEVLAQIAQTNQRLAEIAIGNAAPNGVRKRICKSVHRTSGEPCKAYVQGETEFCVNHQPKGE